MHCVFVHFNMRKGSKGAPSMSVGRNTPITVCKLYPFSCTYLRLHCLPGWCSKKSESKSVIDKWDWHMTAAKMYHAHEFWFADEWKWSRAEHYVVFFQVHTYPPIIQNPMPWVVKWAHPSRYRTLCQGWCRHRWNQNKAGIMQVYLWRQRSRITDPVTMWDKRYRKRRYPQHVQGKQCI